MNLFQIADQIATGKLVEQDLVSRVLRATADLAECRRRLYATQDAAKVARETLATANNHHTFRAPEYRSAQANVRAAEARLTHAQLRYTESLAHLEKLTGV